ncbi:MAG: isoprenylcysteine carboxylmethyltransferase family protein [Planctomycetota bacterium]
MTTTTTDYSSAQRGVALLSGALCHLSFAAGVGLMIWGLHEGLRSGLGPFRGGAALLANALLLAQFPLLHSWLLGPRGARVLARLVPLGLGKDLSTTTFATLSSLQIGLVFLLWSPSGGEGWAPTGALRGGWELVYGLSWLAVVKTMGDAGLGTQMGWLGWVAVARGQRPRYGSFPREGSFRYCRQPIYLSFALTLWTGPVWTADRVLLALFWTAYCYLGPRLKEQRYLGRYGEDFRRYQEEVPYFLPARAGERS